MEAEAVGTQVKLGLDRAFQIAVQGIRIRLGRSLVTVSGVVLGIAFLMSNITGQFIKAAISHEREQRQTVNLMETLVRAEIGNLEGKRIGVAVFGRMTPAEEGLLGRILSRSPAELRGFGVGVPGITPVSLSQLGQGTGLLLLLGNATNCPVSMDILAAGMTQKVILDSHADRVFPAAAAGIRRDVFFGRETKEQVARLRKQATQSRFRTVWIAVISILVTVIGIANALLMSVTERFREIGTMKCLGALSGFIRRLFLIESALIGFAGALVGTVAGALLPIVAYGLTFRFSLVLGTLALGRVAVSAAFCLVTGTLLAMVAAIYPANFAAKMVPASALRTNI